MKKDLKLAASRWQLCRPLIATALAISGTLQLVTAVLAEGTAAGTQITNEATATYEDPNDPNNTPITTTSNQVVIEVAEIAGITVQASGIEFVDDDPATTNVVEGDADSDGKVDPNDQLHYIYTLTNVGNDPTKFYVPNVATVTSNNGTVYDAIEVSYDGINWSAPPADRATTPIAPGGTVLVRVPIQVSSNVQSGDNIEVLLGSTPGDGQNQRYNPNGSNDVYTVDAADGASGIDANGDTIDDEVNGTPANGTREASDRQFIPVDSTLDTQPLVTLKKVLTNHDPNNTASLADDRLTYELRFRVEDTDTTGAGYTPGPLYPINTISVDGSPSSRILVSDALPDGTVLSGTPTAPAGWTVVYNAQDPAAVNATAAGWYTTSATAISNGTAGRITRIGFISSPSLISLAPGTNVQTFRFTVETSNVPSGLTQATFANVAQVFGSAAPNGDPGQQVSDESGDSTPSNYNPALNAGAGGFDPPSDGYIPDANDNGIPDELDPNDAANDPDLGADTSNTNQGTGPGGEANVKTIGLPSPLDVINGPEDRADAVGPTNTSDDFTNKSAPVTPANVTFDSGDNRDELNPAPVDFANTVNNNGQTTGDITLVPQAPTNAGDLPSGTVVTLSAPDGKTAIYNYDGTSFTRTGGTFEGDIVISNVTPGDDVTYGVRIDLPDGTPLSTDIDPNGNQPYGGFGVPIKATLEDAGGNTAENVTIDRVYTGYLRLFKESRILQGSGPVVAAGQGNFSTGPKNPAPGNIIEYRVRYTNISEPASGSNNVVLFAENVVVTEDGTDGDNNWALDNDNNSVIDTSNVQGSATDSNGGSITFFKGVPANSPTTDTAGSDVNTDVTKYINQVPGLIGPSESGFMLFRRVVN